MKPYIYFIGLLMAITIPNLANAGEWEYLDNGTIRIGVDKARGSGIGYFGESKTGRNVLNDFDEGRFVQQSYYGDSDGSFWAKRPWTYNPVQGGSWDGKKSNTLDFKKTDKTLYAKIEPRRWSSGERCPEAIMEETISLIGPVAKITMKMTYTGEDQVKARHQEVPAVFVDASLSNLVYQTDGGLKRRVPGWPNEGGESSEDWVAWLNEDDWGIGIYTPGTKEFTCYRYISGHTNAVVAARADCSYVAPVRTLALKKGLIVEYDVFLTIGTLDEIRSRFEQVKEGTLSAHFE